MDHLDDASPHAEPAERMTRDDASLGILRRARRSVTFRSRRVRREMGQELFAAWLAGHRRARLRDEVADGVTLVAVSWNSLELLRTMLAAVDRFTVVPLEILIVDNGSSDGTQEFLTDAAGVSAVLLGHNWGHGLALDAGIQAARTRYVVTLDVDAFPISQGWLDAVIGPLEAGCTLSGALSSGYIHPCFMAVERHRFLADKHTFAASYHRRLRLTRRRGLPRGWDAGKLITLRDRGPHRGIPATSIRGPGALGTVFGEVVYHHFYATRLRGTPTPDVVRSGVTPEISRAAWDEAVDRYLGAAERR
jgi:hypothetical protein